jgi:hypothetical protein
MPRTNKFNRSYGLSNPLQEVFPEPVVAQRAPTGNDVGYRIGQIWVDGPSNQVYALSSITGGSAVWSILGPGASDVDTLTGDTGGAISPTGGNINILGGDLLTVAGAGSTLTLNATTGAYPITQYVVGASGEAGYTTIQSAIDAIGAAGAGNIWIQPGTYTEDLTFPAGSTIGLVGTSDETTGPTIVGTHTPAADGDIVTWRCAMNSTGHIFNSTAAGTGNITVVHNNMDYNGYLFNLPNWTNSGSLTAGLIADRASTQSGIVNNTGGTTVFLFQNSLGNGATFPLIVSGNSFFERTDFGCPLTLQSTGTTEIFSCQFENTVTVSDSHTVIAGENYFLTDANAALTYNSSGDSVINTSGISSTNNPAIGGTGAGTLTLSGVNFDSNAAIAGTVTLAGGRTVSGSVGLTGGAVTDFIGQATLVAGTVTVANTNIAATDKVIVTREGVGASTALGVLDVSITASTSFTITALQPGTPASTETGDVSIVNYFIVRQL